MTAATWPWDWSAPTTWSFDAGSFLGALLGAVLAASIALWIARRDRTASEESALEEQARQVSAWLCSGWDLDDCADVSAALAFQNSSDSPVYNFRIRVLDPEHHFVPAVDSPLFDCFDRVRPPSRRVVRDDLENIIALADEHGPGDLLAHLVVELQFTDFAGVHWARRAGVLKQQPEAAAPPASYDGW